MSDLVEKVVDAMTAAMDGEDCSSHGMARAAIAAVAEWMSAAIHPEENAYHVREELLKQLEHPK